MQSNDCLVREEDREAKACLQSDDCGYSAYHPNRVDIIDLAPLPCNRQGSRMVQVTLCSTQLRRSLGDIPKLPSYMSKQGARPERWRCGVAELH